MLFGAVDQQSLVVEIRQTLTLKRCKSTERTMYLSDGSRCFPIETGLRAVNVFIGIVEPSRKERESSCTRVYAIPPLVHVFKSDQEIQWVHFSHSPFASHQPREVIIRKHVSHPSYRLLSFVLLFRDPSHCRFRIRHSRNIEAQHMTGYRDQFNLQWLDTAPACQDREGHIGAICKIPVMTSCFIHDGVIFLLNSILAIGCAYWDISETRTGIRLTRLGIDKGFSRRIKPRYIHRGRTHVFHGKLLWSQ